MLTDYSYWLKSKLIAYFILAHNRFYFLVLTPLVKVMHAILNGFKLCAIKILFSRFRRGSETWFSR